MVEIPYQAVEPKGERVGLSGLELVAIMGGVLLVGIAALKTYKWVRNYLRDKPLEFDSSPLYPAINPQAEKEARDRERN